MIKVIITLIVYTIVNLHYDNNIYTKNMYHV